MQRHDSDDLLQRFKQECNTYVVIGITQNLKHAREIGQLDIVHEKRLLDSLASIYALATDTFFTSSAIVSVYKYVGNAALINLFDDIYNDMFSAFLEH